jgi:hypothetical protein
MRIAIQSTGVTARPRGLGPRNRGGAYGHGWSAAGPELMTQGKDFSLQSYPRSEERRHGEKQEDEKGKHGSGSLHAAASQIQSLQ